MTKTAHKALTHTSTPMRTAIDIHAGSHNTSLGLTQVTRAWPHTNGSITAEAIDTNQRVRAVHIAHTGNIDLLPYASDPLLPGLTPEHQGVLAVHRHSKRAVVLNATHIYKYVRTGKAHKIAHTWTTMSALCHQAGIYTPPFELSHSTPDKNNRASAYLIFPRIEGKTLHDLGNEGMPGWTAFTQMWASLAQSSATHAPNTTSTPLKNAEKTHGQETGKTLPQETELPLHTPKHEATVLNSWFTHARNHGLLESEELLRCAIEHTTRELLDTRQETPQEHWTTSHRDLHDKQLLWDGTKLTLLDIDTAARAERALDLANLRAHIDLRFLQGKIHEEMHSTLMEMTAALADDMAIRPQRLHTYESASRLRLACVYSFRPTAQGWLNTWIEHTLNTTL